MKRREDAKIKKMKEEKKRAKVQKTHLKTHEMTYQQYLNVPHHNVFFLSWSA